MRKRRAIIYDDNLDVSNVLREHFTLRGYDVLTYHETGTCPAYEDRAACKEPYPFALALINQKTPVCFSHYFAR